MPDLKPARHAAPRPRVVGRDAELDTLRQALERGASGTASPVLVSGDPGIGKTVLVQHAVQQWVPPDLPRLAVTCLPLHALHAGLAPLRTAILRSGASPALVRSCLQHFDADPLRAVDDWVDDVTAQHGVVVVVDDVQWADDVLCDALLYLVTGSPRRRASFLFTARATGLPDGHLLHGWLAELQRFPSVVRLDVGPLSRAATELQLAALLGETPHQSLVDDVFAAGRGNPFLSALLVREVQPTDRHLPPTYPRDLVAAVTGLWHGCSSEARTATCVLAVAGSPRTASDLASVATRLELSLDVTRALREAESAGMLERTSDETLWFRHPLHAEVLVQTMSDLQRRSIHAAYAELDDHNQRPAYLSELEFAVQQANRHARAGSPQAAYRCAMRAWEHRGDEVPSSDLRRMLRQAIDLRSQVPDAEEDEIELWRRLRGLALDAGAYTEELEAVDKLIDLIDPTQEPLAVSELLVWRMLLRIATATGFHSVEDMERAVELATTDPTSWQCAMARAELAHAASWHGHPRAADFSAQALTLAEAVNHPTALSLALTAASITALDSDDSERALRLATAAADIAIAHYDWWPAVHAVMWETNAWPDRFSRSEVDQLAARRQQLVDHGAPMPYVLQVTGVEAELLLELGDALACRRLLREALVSDPGPIADLRARLTLARAAAYQGRPAEALAHLDRARELIAGPLRLPMINLDATWATALLEAGRPAEAYRVAMAAADSPGNPVDMVERLVPLAARALADQLQDLPEAQRIDSSLLWTLDHLRMVHPTVISDYGVTSDLGRAQLVAMQRWYDAETARARRDTDEAARWQTMSQTCGASSLPWLQAYACWRTAETLLAKGHGGRAEGARWLKTGLQLAKQLGADSIRSELVDLARLAHVDLATAPVPIPVEHPLLTELTAREREIVAMLATGRTYAEIATSLVISEKTVSSHVSNILRKTGTTSRVELTRQLGRS